MRSSSIGLSAFRPFRTRDRHFEFASLLCLRGDRPRSATRIDRRILLKNDLLAFVASSSIDAASSSAELQSASVQRKTQRAVLAFGFFGLFLRCAAVCKSPG